MRCSNAVRYGFALLATLVATSAAAQSVDVRTASVEGVTHATWTPTGLGAPAADGIVLGQPVSLGHDNSPPTLLRQHPAGSIRLQNANDSAVAPTHVDLVAISGDLRAMGIPAEIGSLEMDHVDQYVEFEQPFAVPPVVFTTQSTQRGGQPAYTFASEVNEYGVQIKLREPSGWDQWHVVENVRYLAIEPGEYPLPDGRWLSVGQFDSWVGSGHSARYVEPQVPVRVGAAVIGTVQSRWSETPAQNIRLYDQGDAGQTFEVVQQNFGDPAGHHVVSGYLIVGERVDPVAVTLLGSGPGQDQWQRVQTGASIEYMTEANNRCYTLADFGMDQLQQVDVVGAGRGKTSVVLFDGPRCAGQSRVIDAYGLETVSLAGYELGNFNYSTRSFRIIRRTAAHANVAQNAETCFAPGDVLLDNGAAQVKFTADGDLGIFKYNPDTDGLQGTWTAGIAADALCLSAMNNGWQQSVQLIARQNGMQVWNSGSAWFQNARLTLTDDCTLAFTEGEYNRMDIGGENGCHTGLSVPTPDPTPVPKLIFGDVDGDEDPEMVLMLTKADGSGYLMYDPLGIADFFYTVGLAPDADFIEALSQTQRATLQQQTQNVVAGGVTTIEQLLEVLARMHPALQTDMWGNPVYGAGNQSPNLYRMFEFDVAVDVSAVEAEAEWNGFEADASVGNFEFEMHRDADSFGYNVSASAAEASAGYDGYVTVEASVLSAEAGMYVGNDGVAVGGGADVVAVTFRGGREDRTHIGISAGVGVGFWAEARWGRDDLYGFTLDLPIFPVGIAIYVRGDDVKWLGHQIVVLVDRGLYEGEQLGRMIWQESSSWAVGAYGDSAVFVSNTYNDTRAFVEKTSNGALVGLESGMDATVAWVEGAGWTLHNAVNSMGNAIEQGGEQAVAEMEQVVNQVGGWAEGAANDAGNWFEGAANDVGNFFGGLF